MNNWWDDTGVITYTSPQGYRMPVRYKPGEEGGVITITRKALENLLRDAGYTIPNTLLVEEQFEPQPYLVG